MKFWNDLAGWRAGDVVGILEDEETVGEVNYMHNLCYSCVIRRCTYCSKAA